MTVRLHLVQQAIWLLLALLWSPTATAAPSLQLPVFTLAQLQAANAATLQRAGEAIERYGVFAVTGVQGSASTSDLAGQALQGLVSCADRGLLNGILKQVTLEDGTLRSTLATTTDANTPQPLPATVVQSCPQFAQAASSLRAAVVSVGEAYSSVLDKLMYGDAACRTPAQCFASAVREGESLEHFHVFKSSDGGRTATGAKTDPSSMLSMHSDIGLFLVMTPAQYFAAGGDKHAFAVSGSSAHDLRVALPQGEVVEPLFPADCVLVMNGEGLSRWMSPSAAGHVHPWSPMHEVLSQHMGNSVRAWFGRMYFPPHHAMLSDGSDSSQPLTFKEYRQQTYTAFREGKGATASTLGCSPSRRLLVDEGSCGSGEIFCWHSCMPVTSSLTCNTSQITCQNKLNGKLWPRDYNTTSANGTQQIGHCMDCGLTCPTLASLSPPTTATGPPPSPSSAACRDVNVLLLGITVMVSALVARLS